VQQPGENGVNTTFQYVRGGVERPLEIVKGGLNKSLRSSTCHYDVTVFATASGTANSVCELVVGHHGGSRAGASQQAEAAHEKRTKTPTFLSR
jgi:hypothetical protein